MGQCNLAETIVEKSDLHFSVPSGSPGDPFGLLQPIFHRRLMQVSQKVRNSKLVLVENEFRESLNQRLNRFRHRCP